MPAQTKSTQTEFQQRETYTPQTKEEKLLIKALAQAKNEEEVGNFLRDLLTPNEISELANRVQIASLLLQKENSYLDIAKLAKTSTTTVTRVAHWLFNGCGGYYTLLKRVIK